MNAAWYRETAEGVVVSVRVVPRAATNAVAGLHGAALKVRLQAPPVEGRANAALTAFLAEALGLPPRQVVLLAGATGRDKRVLIRGLPAARIADRLAVGC